MHARCLKLVLGDLKKARCFKSYILCSSSHSIWAFTEIVSPRYMLISFFIVFSLCFSPDNIKKVK
jgi:hypothetical protein